MIWTNCIVSFHPKLLGRNENFWYDLPGGGKRNFFLAGEARFWLGNGIFGFCLGGEMIFWPQTFFLYTLLLKYFQPWHVLLIQIGFGLMVPHGLKQIYFKCFWSCDTTCFELISNILVLCQHVFWIRLECFGLVSARALNNLFRMFWSCDTTCFNTHYLKLYS